MFLLVIASIIVGLGLISFAFGEDAGREVAKVLVIAIVAGVAYFAYVIATAPGPR